jgi:hypothetical protein
MFTRTKLPTDLEILDFIYTHYFDDFCRYDLDENIRANKLYVPIDCHLIADAFGTNGDIIFGRLYYYLAHKYKYKSSDKTTVSIFEFEVGDEPKCVNFPFLASVLADLKLQDKRFKYTLRASVSAVIISLVALGMSVMDKLT